MKVLSSIISCFALVFSLNAQTTDGLVAYYDFNDSTLNDQTGSGSNGIGVPVVGFPMFACGADGLALRLDGVDNFVLFTGLIDNYFENDDLTFGFFMKPDMTQGTKTIFSKKEACNDENAFAIRYTSVSNTLTVEMSESPSKRVVLNTPVDLDKCWQQVTVVRQGGTVRLFVNGTLRETGSTTSRIDIESAGVFSLAEGPCVGLTDLRYGGLIDEIRLYDRALDEEEVEGLYVPLIPDNIITPNTTVFLGNDVQIETGNTCAESVLWSPSVNVSDPNITEPVITPDETTTYYLSFMDSQIGGCNTSDSIRITVIDPADLDCKKAFMPNAFTPNGDGRNDTYGISNPYAIADLISLEIFDRWGGRVFMTTNSMEQWDGNFKGSPMNPGVLLYKIIHRCNGEEIVDVGSLSIIR